MLSDRFIRNAKPGMYADGGGLYLQVYATGKKAFLHRTQVGGRSTKRVIGHYPAMGLAAAREAVEQLASGFVSMTVRDAFEEYFKHAGPRHRKPELLRRTFEKDILPTIADVKLEDLTRADLTRVFKIPVARGAPTTGNAALMATKTFLNYCEAMGWMQRNPIEKTKKETIGGPAKAKDRTLSWAEISDFLHWLADDKRQIEWGTRVGLYLCLLTGQRAAEVLSFRMTGRPYMEGDAKRTRAGPVRYKVPLTPEIKAAVTKFTPRPARPGTLSQCMAREGFDFTPHDLRRTFASRLADLGVFPHVVEKLLNHKMVGVMATYNRSEYWPERVEAQRMWGRKLRELRKNPRPEPGITTTGE